MAAGTGAASKYDDTDDVGGDEENLWKIKQKLPSEIEAEITSRIITDDERCSMRSLLKWNC